MQNFILIYCYLIIALITFGAPIILFLLSISSDGTTVVKKRATEQTNQIQELLRTQINSTSNFDSSLISESNKALKKVKKKNNSKLNCLNPKRQTIRVFSSLFGALFLVMIDMLVKDHDLGLYQHNLSMGLLIISFLLFIIAVLILQQVAWEIINTKQILSEEQTNITVEKSTE